MFCPECGEDAGEAKFCPECGADLAAVRAARASGAGRSAGAHAEPPVRAGGKPTAKTTGTYAAGKTGERSVQVPQAKASKVRLNSVTLWVIVAAVAAVAIAAVVIFGGGSSNTATSASSSASSASPAPTTADLSGTYADLVARANGLYDQGATQMTNGIPTQQSSQYFVVAAQVYAAAWKKQSTSPDVGTDYSTALFYAGNVDGALKQIEVVLTKSPTFQPALYNKGLFLWHQAQMSSGATKTQLTAQAKQVLQAAIKLSPSSTVGKNAAQVLSNIK
ncbi:MAG: hypothetical protein ACLQUT_00175 [Thermoleophilia bacterium]